MTFRRFAPCVCVAVLVGALGAMTASAATIQMSMQYMGSLDAGFNPIGNPLTDDPNSVLPTDYHQFDVRFQISGALANEDLQLLQFDMQLGPGLTPADFGGYIGITPNFDPVGPTPNAAIYGTNTDAGADPNDLERITVIANGNPAYVHGFRPGIVGTGKVGEVYVQLDTSLAGSSTFLHLAGNSSNPWFTYVGTTPQVGPPGSFSVGPDFIIELGPPPVGPDVEDNFLHPQMDGSADANPTPIEHTVQLLAGTPPITWDNFMLESFTPNYGNNSNTSGPFFDATFDPLTQLFSWNPVGSPRGDYVWKVTASNDVGSDVGRVTVQIKTVPEPATLALFGLAIVGLVGVARRRS